LSDRVTYVTGSAKLNILRISVPFENCFLCVLTSTSLKQCNYIIMQNACFQTELKFTALDAYLHNCWKNSINFLNISVLVKERPNHKNLDIILFDCSRGVGKSLFSYSRPKDMSFVYVTSKRSYSIDFSSWISPLRMSKGNTYPAIYSWRA